jgi:hypothetical protein
MKRINKDPIVASKEFLEEYSFSFRGFKTDILINKGGCRNLARGGLIPLLEFYELTVGLSDDAVEYECVVVDGKEYAQSRDFDDDKFVLLRDWMCRAVYCYCLRLSSGCPENEAKNLLKGTNGFKSLKCLEREEAYFVMYIKLLLFAIDTGIKYYPDDDIDSATLKFMQTKIYKEYSENELLEAEASLL